MNSSDGLKAAIVARHRTVYAFCRAYPELARSTVYLILSGKYPGNHKRQTAKIREVLTGDAGPRRVVIQAHEAFEVLQAAKCAHCRKLDKRGCAECKTQTTREAQALADYLAAKEAQE